MAFNNVLLCFIIMSYSSIYEEIIEVKEWTPYLGQDEHISLDSLDKRNMNNQ